MDTPRPTREDMLALAAYLPRLHAEGFRPITEWRVAEDKGTHIACSPPAYHPLVEAFVKEASKECWSDYAYDEDRAEAMLKDPEAVARADVDQIKTMLTYFVRGERFGDGHWARLIREGQIRRLLERVAELAEQEGEGAA